MGTFGQPPPIALPWSAAAPLDLFPSTHPTPLSVAATNPPELPLRQLPLLLLLLLLPLALPLLRCAASPPCCAASPPCCAPTLCSPLHPHTFPRVGPGLPTQAPGPSVPPVGSPIWYHPWHRPLGHSCPALLHLCRQPSGLPAVDLSLAHLLLVVHCAHVPCPLSGHPCGPPFPWTCPLSLCLSLGHWMPCLAIVVGVGIWESWVQIQPHWRAAILVVVGW